MRLIDVHINCPDAATAMKIGEKLIEQRLAACANVGGAIASIYSWKGKTERGREFPLVVKTRAEHFDRVAAEVAALHPFEVPAITATEIVDASPAYRDWLVEETAPT